MFFYYIFIVPCAQAEAVFTLSAPDNVTVNEEFEVMVYLDSNISNVRHYVVSLLYDPDLLHINPQLDSLDASLVDLTFISPLGIDVSGIQDNPARLIASQTGVSDVLDPSNHISLFKIKMQALHTGTATLIFKEDDLKLKDQDLEDIPYSANSIQIQILESVFLSGDANGDGRINVLDVISVINKILDPNNSLSGDTDCNGDELMNVLDVICIINKILNSNELYD